MKRFFILFVLMGILSISVSGCLSGGSSNPVGPAPEVTSINTPEESVATDSATLTIRVVLPSRTTGIKSSTRPSTVSATISVPYASATLLVDGKVNQRKQGMVTNGSVTLSFLNVPNSGTATLYLELIGCSIDGVHNFSGSTSLTSGENVVTLSPYIVPGSNRTSDGKVLVEISNSCYRGKATFNDAGQLIGFGVDGWVTNYITGEKYFDLSALVAQNQDIAFTDLAWFEDKIWLGGQDSLTAYDPITETYQLYGDPRNPALTTDGADLNNVKFAAIRDLQVHKDTLYISTGNFTQIVALKNGVFSIAASNVNQDGLSILDNGDIWGFYHWENHIPYNVRINDGNIVEKVGLGDDFGTRSAVAYKSGILFSRDDAIYYWDGTTSTKWLTPESVGGDVNTHGAFFIYKNAQGTIYVCSEYANKIWEVK